MPEGQTPIDLQMGKLLAGKYRLERVLGRGGMGAVVLAHHEELDLRVAVKILLPEVAARPDVVARFVREARAAAKLESEHVVRVTDVGRDTDVGAYMAMEYLQGTDLAHALQKRGPFPIPEAVDCILEAIDALAEAHAHGIVHRDIKPANLFLAQRADGTETVKVLDFGISKMDALGDSAGDKLTSTRAVMGSPGYMSPEQIQTTRDVDARADIWSIGAVLFELLTKAPPFDGETIGQIFANVLSKEPKSARAIRKDVPEKLAAIIRRCMHRDLNARYDDVGELARALAPFGSGRAEKEVQRAASVLQRRPRRAAVATSSNEPAERQNQRTQDAWNAPARAPTAPLVVAAAGIAVVVSGIAIGAFVLSQRSVPPAAAARDALLPSTTVSVAPVATSAAPTESSREPPTVSVAELPSAKSAKVRPTETHAPRPTASQPSFLDRQR